MVDLGITFRSLALVASLSFVVLVPSALATGVLELAAEGQLEELEEALKESPELLNTPDPEGRTLLYLACDGNHVEVARFLLERGANGDAVTIAGNRPLHVSAYRNQIGVIQVLLEQGVELSPVDHRGNTPLHYAALADNAEAVALLVSAGANTEIQDAYGRTPLTLGARERGGTQTIKALLDGGATVDIKDKFGEGALELAAWRGKTEVVDLLLNAGAALPSDGEPSRRLFTYAAENGLTRLFKALLEAGGDPRFKTPNNVTLVHRAAAGGSLEILKSLGEKGLDLGARDDYGWTPLHYAARDGREECVRWLQQNKAELNARSVAGQTAYNVARDRGMSEVEGLLKEIGADTGAARFPILEGAYLGQHVPGDEPQRFATGVISSIWGLHSSVAFSRDGNLVLWSPMVDIPGEIYSRGYIWQMRRMEGRWTPPEPAPFTDDGRGDVAFFAPGSERVYFLSRRTLPGEPESQRERIWYSDRKGERWSAARLVDTVVNEFPQHWQFSVDAQHSIYFSANLPNGLGRGDIYRADRVDGTWLEPVNLGAPVNSPDDEATPFVAADGSYLVVQRNGDLFISYRIDDARWSEPQNLGKPINSAAHERCPVVSPDGKYMFFVSTRNTTAHVFWVAADFIEKLRPLPRDKEGAS